MKIYMPFNQFLDFFGFFFIFFWSRLRNSIAECNHFMLYFLQDQRGAGFTKIYICGFFLRTPLALKGLRQEKTNWATFCKSLPILFFIFV